MSEKNSTGDTPIVQGEIVDHSALSLEELSRACCVQPDWVVERVESGLLGDGSSYIAHWRFSSYDLRRARRLYQLERDFEASPELAAFCADLLEQIDQLKRQQTHKH